MTTRLGIIEKFKFLQLTRVSDGGFAEDEWRRRRVKNIRRRKSPPWPIIGGILTACLFLLFGHKLIPTTAHVTLVSLEPQLPDTGQQARAVVHQFLAAQSFEEKLALVRHPSRVAPFMKRYYATPAGDHSPSIEFSDRHWEEMDGTNSELVKLECLTDGMPQCITIEKTPDGLKLDWESFVIYETTPFKEFISATSSSEGEYRVTVQPDDYYNFAYSDHEKYAAYRIEIPSGETSVHAYALRESPAGKELERLFDLAGQESFNGSQKMNPMLPFTLILRSDRDSKGQLAISEVVSDSWVVRN
ncbi:MAG: hypothetical protein R3F19_06620 [Verrucomicrobiales bacterium]